MVIHTSDHKFDCQQQFDSLGFVYTYFEVDSTRYIKIKLGDEFSSYI